MASEITIPYGESNLEFVIPEDMNIISNPETNGVSGLEDDKIYEKVQSQLKNPIGMEKLSDQIDQNTTIAIVVDDISRPTPSSKLTKPLIDYLIDDLRVRKENIVFIFGLGVHRNMTQEEAEIKLGKEIANEFRWENHDCYENLVDLGKSSRGTPILINKTYYDADYKISIGLIEPHLWAGFSGGAKGIIPGIGGLETIVENHKLVKKANVEVGRLENNPFREDLEEMVDIIGLDLLLNVVLTPAKEIHKVIAGSANDAFMRGVDISRELSEVEVDKKTDIVISSPNPLGIDFRQSSKAAFNTMKSLKKGGVMIVVSECPEGKGNIKLSDKPPKRWLIKLLAKILPAWALMWVIKKQGFGVEDAAGTFQMFKFISKYHYIFVSDSLTDEDRKAIFVADHAKTINEALEMAKEKLGKDRYTVNIFKQGGSTFPILNE